MTRKIAEINIDTKDGGFISGLLKVKSQERLHKKLNKMLNKGALTMGCMTVKAQDIAHMELRLQWVH